MRPTLHHCGGMPVQFKFRGEKAFRSLLNVTTPCTLQRVKTAIYEQARISDSATDLALDDAATGAAVSAAALFAASALVQLVVRRVPFAQDALAVPAFAAVVEDDVLRTEEDMAIDRIVEMHDVTAMGMSSGASGSASAKYPRSFKLNSVVKKREGYEGSDDEEVFEAVEPPPENYTCYRCGKIGVHWIWECPTNDDPDHVKKVRTARGVPRAFLQKVATIEEGQELSAGGVTFTLPGHSGHYIIAHQDASLEERKRRLGDTVQEKLTTAFTEGARRVEESLKCPLCRQMFRQAILAPCCGATFCSDCIIDRLAHSSVENSVCPGCDKEVLAHQLVANEDIRRQVDQISRSSKAAAIASQKEQELRALEEQRGRGSVLGPGLKVNSRSRGSGGEVLALTDGPAAAPRPTVVVWPPLGFGPRLSREQLVAWQRALKGASLAPDIKGQFEEWRRQSREAAEAAKPQPLQAGPESALSAPVLHSKESFEAWQRMLRDTKPSRKADRKKARSRSRSPIRFD